MQLLWSKVFTKRSLVSAHEASPGGLTMNTAEYSVRVQHSCHRIPTVRHTRRAAAQDNRIPLSLDWCNQLDLPIIYHPFNLMLLWDQCESCKYQFNSFIIYSCTKNRLFVYSWEDNSHLYQCISVTVVDSLSVSLRWDMHVYRNVDRP